MKLYTIGFTRTSAEDFFGRLRRAGVRKVIDVRLNNTSQLAGFAKGRDLPYFLKQIADIDYEHLPRIAPTQQILDAYKKNKGDWSVYERDFRALLNRRSVESRLEPRHLDKACLLCSEPTADRCHRRLVAEYLNERWGQPFRIEHL